MKACRICGVEKPLDEFSPRASARDGRRSECRACRRPLARGYTAAWRDRNPEKVRSANELAKTTRVVERRGQVKDWRRRNPEKRKEQKRRYQQRHQTEIRERIAGWFERNRGAMAYHTATRRARAAGVVIGDLTAVREFYLHVNTAPAVACHWCGEPVSMSDREVDHLIPLCRGGAHDRSNLVASCTACNMSKHSKLPEEFLAGRNA